MEKFIHLRYILPIVLITVFAATSAQAQSVLYLKNGSAIKGEIIELNPEENVKIQTRDGSLFVYSVEDVDHVEKEQQTKQYYSLVDQYGEIYRHKGQLYLADGNLELSNPNTPNVLDPTLSRIYKSAQKQYKNGNTFLYIGCGSLGMSIINIILNASLSNYAYDYDYDTYAFFASMSLLFALGADAGICLGCVFKSIGKHRLEYIKNKYNSGTHNLSASTPTLRFAPAMLTAQHNIGLGASVVLNF